MSSMPDHVGGTILPVTADSVWYPGSASIDSTNVYAAGRWDSLQAVQQVQPRKQEGPPVILYAYDLTTSLGPVILLAWIAVTLHKRLKP